MKSLRALLQLSAIMVLVASVCVAEQVTAADYARADQFLPWNSSKLVLNAGVKPQWIGKSSRFYYRRQLSNEEKQFVLVDPATGKSGPAFDHARLAESLSKATGKTTAVNKLPFESFEFSKDEKSIEFDIAAEHWACNVSTYACEKKGAPDKPVPTESLSPDKKWATFVREHDLYVKPVGGGEEIRLTNDGKEYDDYASHPDSDLNRITVKLIGDKNPLLAKSLAPEVLWSPDSKRILTYRLDQTTVKETYLVQHVPPTGQRPVLHTFRIPMPGEEIASAKFIVFDIAQKKRVDLDIPAQLMIFDASPIDMGFASWDKEGQQIYFLHMDRYWRNPQLMLSDAETGKNRTLVEEHVETHFDFGPNIAAPPMLRVIGHGAEVIWYSERDGWGQLYLYDGKTGALKNRITIGSWVVNDISYVDEVNRWVYFSASGKEPGENPYLQHLYRVKLDGSSLQLLTPEPADHEVSFSPDNRYFLDTYSRADTAPITVLRSTEGKLIREVERADISAVIAKGWKFPEPFSAKAADGSTDIYGLIYKPTNFDPLKKYPVLDSDYPGPQIVRVPRSFSGGLLGGSFSDLYGLPQATAELGFIVVVVDGRGTPGRSKAFHDAAYGKMGEAGSLQDHVAAIRQLAQTRPYMDLDRVGIYGHSGGGFASARAILAYPDFFKVAVASAGNHDQRGYIAHWGEKYMGPLSGDNYLEAATVTLAANLKGKLLLMWGDMDDNVPPALSIQLVDALIKANKDFDLLVLPNRNHGGMADPYFIRRRWDYFVKNLLGTTPPPYKIENSMPGYMTVEGPPAGDTDKQEGKAP